MPTARTASLALTLTALAALAAPGARAQTTTLNGNYSNNKAGDGYNTTPGQSYAVAAPAAFDNNGNAGLFANGSTVSVSGGDFSGNNNAGLLANRSMVSVSGGTFTGNGADGLDAEGGSTVSVTGGTFTGNGRADLLANASSPLTLFGTGLMFTGQPAGTATLTADNFGDPLTGTVTGRLRNNAASSTLSFFLANGSSLTLVNAPVTPPAVPEVSSLAPFAAAGLGLLGLGIRARRRK